MTTIPIIKLEVESMKYAIRTALSEHAFKMDEQIQAAVEAYCKEENINRIVREEAIRHIDAAVKEEVRNFFQWSKPGRQAIKEAVYSHLEEWDKYRSEIEDGK